jgi:ApaG protein
LVCNAGSDRSDIEHTWPKARNTRSPSARSRNISPSSRIRANDHYVFAYTITIENVGTVPAQLISRHWIITDASGEVQEVRGLGVVGRQPLLQPGEKFAYTSGCQLDTPVGTMRGSYQLTAVDGRQFEAEIPEFTLAVPHVLH